jgi:murein DD-endopeptidase MepM/ murein hydrolase activator NlpD
MMRVVPRRSRAKLGVLVVLLLLLVVVGGVSYLAWRQSVPDVRVTGEAPRFLGRRTPVAFTLEAAGGRVVSGELRVVQTGGAPVTVARLEGGAAPRVELRATIEPGAAGLREGPATLDVWARDDFWRPLGRADRAVASFPVTVDFTPPPLDLVAATPYVAPGGAGVVAFRTEAAARAEARVGELAFPTFALGPAGTRVAFFALPWDFAGGAVGVSAADEAGNAVTRSIPAEVLPRRFRRDVIEITDAFLQAKVPELLPQHPPSQPLVEGFLVINRDQRRFAEEEKRRVAARTADRPLWQGTFRQPRNTKVFSNFAESRTYRYQGREIDSQVHFGYDLASTRQAPVPAANSGVVVFAAPLTIYGNTVILDHGLGLMTLYAHLSSIAVKVGDQVAKGQELGRTGTTGLAVGDHLHYEVLVHGVSVTPLEWWDPKWIRDRITGPLRAAGVDVSALEPSGDDAAPARRRGR